MGRVKWGTPDGVISFVGDTNPPIMHLHHYRTPTTPSVEPCSGDDDCAFCKVGHPVEKRIAVTFWDKVVGRSAIMLLTEAEYQKLINIKPTPWWKRAWLWIKLLVRCKS